MSHEHHCKANRNPDRATYLQVHAVHLFDTKKEQPIYIKYTLNLLYLSISPHPQHVSLGEGDDSARKIPKFQSNYQ